ncbi:MAG: ribosome-associated translation inhibitor RaiA [Dehalococcoidia bacterium]|nr:ribosome-associated translation inhibitor RaiA [Dehalococcoidia bacterium]
MELEIRGKNLDLTDVARDQISRKLSRLGRRLPEISTAVVELARERSRSQRAPVVAQVTLNIDGTVLRGEERGSNAVAAVDAVIDVMDRRVERYKGKAYRSQVVKKSGRNASIRTEGAPAPSEAEIEEDAVSEADGRVVRTKRFAIKPMTLEEAAFQMDLLGHDFFLFRDGETEEYNLLYRRRDGDYGLIQPEPL